MDVLTIVTTMWRNKVLSSALVLATVGGCLLAWMAVPPVYEASGSYALEFPEPAPTQAQVERDPTLATVRADNPYLRFGDPTVAIEIVVRRVMEARYRDELSALGADPRYEVRPSARFGAGGPIIDVYAAGDTPDAAATTLELVGEALTTELDVIQREDVDSAYRFGLRPVESPATLYERPYGRARAVAGVLALGALLMIVMVATLRRASSPPGRR